MFATNPIAASKQGLIADKVMPFGQKHMLPALILSDLQELWFQAWD